MYPLNWAKTPVVSPDFIAELTNVLASNGCEGLFGTDSLVDDNWAKLTIGNVSVIVPSNGKERRSLHFLLRSLSMIKISSS